MHEPWPWQAGVAGSPRGPAALLVSGGGGYQAMDLPFTYGSRISAIGRDGSYRVLPFGATYLQAGQDVLLSPDGRYAAGNGTYERLLGTGDTDVSIVDLTTGEERRHQGSGPAVPVAWSHDGRRLLVHRFGASSWADTPFDGADTTGSDNGALWLLDVGSGAATHLLDLGRTRRGAAAFSPDGRTVAVQLGRELALVDTATGTRRPLATLPAGAHLGGPWSYTADGTGLGVLTIADGCTTACSNVARNARSWRLTVLSTTTGTALPTTFPTFGGATARLAGWQRDGTAVLVRYTDETNGGEPSYDPPAAYRAVSDADLLALTPAGTTKSLLTKPKGVIWDVDVATDLVTAGAFGGPSPAPSVLPLARWAATTVFVALWALAMLTWLTITLRRRSRRRPPPHPAAQPGSPPVRHPGAR
ncbi:hypothetical protein AB0J72_36020 [Dactylosporangium sp. NPDC049742]|uniref:hypothetical protein n=1 Tax=Dactylosporangium sp. NPDC049742 TaxID=3154737 RepID=UPI00341F4D9A